MRMTFADNILKFYDELHFNGELPEGITMMNPYRENPETVDVMRQFYHKYYHDHRERVMILGINPGRFGAGVTGIPFTDTKRLSEKCGITMHDVQTHETSSVFVYEVIDAFGGPQAFYEKFYISAISPLGFTYTGRNGKEVNYNYYDSKELMTTLHDFIHAAMVKQLDFGINRDVCFCLGTGKNEKFLSEFNKEYGFFKKITALEHPRYIMQYKLRDKGEYLRKYMKALS